MERHVGPADRGRARAAVAWSTSQSTQIVRLSVSFLSVDHGAQGAADQPLDLHRAPVHLRPSRSRGLRDPAPVEEGSIEYSAVIQPCPLPLRNLRHAVLDPGGGAEDAGPAEGGQHRAGRARAVKPRSKWMRAHLVRSRPSSAGPVMAGSWERRRRAGPERKKLGGRAIIGRREVGTTPGDVGPARRCAPRRSVPGAPVARLFTVEGSVSQDPASARTVLAGEHSSTGTARRARSRVEVVGGQELLGPRWACRRPPLRCQRARGPRRSSTSGQASTDWRARLVTRRSGQEVPGKVLWDQGRSGRSPPRSPAGPGPASRLHGLDQLRRRRLGPGREPSTSLGQLTRRPGDVDRAASRVPQQAATSAAAQGDGPGRSRALPGPGGRARSSGRAPRPGRSPRSAQRPRPAPGRARRGPRRPSARACAEGRRRPASLVRLDELVAEQDTGHGRDGPKTPPPLHRTEKGEVPDAGRRVRRAASPSFLPGGP